MLTDNVKEYPIEIQASQYYIHNSYVNTYYYVYKFLEEWIAKNIFRNDKSRVFLSSDEYSYRRRFELTDTSKDFNTLDFSSLRLPFANYWPQNSGWQSDDRVAAKSAALTYLGIYEGDTKIKAASSTIDITTTFYFDREDDARLAYEILYFKSFNEQYNSTKVPYGRNNTVTPDKGSYSSILNLPVNITVSKLEFNPSYKENDWLKKQRVFIIRTTFTVRTYTILPPEQPNYDVEMNSNGYLSNGSAYEDGINYYYIVDDVILNMSHKDRQIITCDAGYNEIDGSYLGTTSFPIVGEEDTIYVDSYCGDQISENPKPLSFYVWDFIKEKYVSPEKELDIASIRYNGIYEENKIDIKRFDCVNGVGITTNTLEWEYGENTSPEDISSIEIHLLGKDNIELVDTTQTSYTIKGLTGGSQYTGYVIFYSKNGVSKKMVINFITNKKQKDKTKPEANTNSLIGITW